MEVTGMEIVVEKGSLFTDWVDVVREKHSSLSSEEHELGVPILNETGAVDWSMSIIGISVEEGNDMAGMRVGCGLSSFTGAVTIEGCSSGRL